MSVTVGNIIPAKEAENAQTAQYTAEVTTIIDKFTATNTGGATPSISINIVPLSGSAGDDNLIVKSKAFAADETYEFPELVGHTMKVGDFISTIASATGEITIRASGRLIT
jgi:hypothetical protein